MAEVHVPRDFAERMAATVGRRLAERAAAACADTARRQAPDAKTWITERDDRVRASHVLADEQVVPDNIPFRVPALRYVPKGRDQHGKAINPAGGYEVVPGQFEHADRPRDPQLTIANRIECRCHAVPLPGVIAAAIRAGEPVVDGSQVHVEVTCRFRGAPESERAERGGGWMRAGAEEAARVLREADPGR